MTHVFAVEGEPRRTSGERFGRAWPEGGGGGGRGGGGSGGGFDLETELVDWALLGVPLDGGVDCKGIVGSGRTVGCGC